MLPTSTSYDGRQCQSFMEHHWWVVIPGNPVGPTDHSSRQNASLFFTEEPVTYFSFTEVKKRFANRSGFLSLVSAAFCFMSVDHDEKNPVGISSAAPPPPNIMIWHHGSRMCLPLVYMSNIQPSNVFSLPLLAEIFTWDGVWEVRRGVLRIRTLHPRSQ